MIRFACPNCKNPMRADRAAAGQVGACTRCGQPVTVPLASSQAAAESEPETRAKPVPVRVRPGKPPAGRIVIWVMALIPLLLSFVVSATSAFNVLRNHDAPEGLLVQVRDFSLLATASVCTYCLARAFDRLIGD
jgi:hypothetical protein